MSTVPRDISEESISRSLDGLTDRKAKVDLMLSYADRASDAGAHDRALELAGGALHIATLHKYKLGIAHSYRSLGRALLRSGQSGEAVLQLRKAVRELEAVEDSEAAQQTASELAEALAASGDRTGAIAQLEVALRIAESRDDREGVAGAYEAIAAMHAATGDQRSSLRSWLTALELREALGEDDAIALAYSNVGIVYGQLGEFRQALTYFTRAIEAAHRGGNRLLEVRTMVNASRAHYSLGELDPALEIAFKALAIYDELGDTDSIPGVLSDIGSIHERLGELDVALDYHRKALEYLRGSEPDSLQVRLFLSVANLYNRAGLFGDALGIATQAIELARELEDPSLEYQLHYALATSYEALDDPRRSLSHFKSYSTIRDEVQGAEMRRSIAEMQMRFDVERTAREREIYRLKSEQLERDMQHKLSELTAMALNQVQKNELLDRLSAHIKELATVPADKVRRHARSLLNEITEGRTADDSWKQFEQQLTLLHGDFVARLTQQFPKLAPAELKVCSLLRLDLSSKQIAELTGTSEKTVQNHRFRIKKKIDPDSDMKLVNFLRGI